MISVIRSNIPNLPTALIKQPGCNNKTKVPLINMCEAKRSRETEQNGKCTNVTNCRCRVGPSTSFYTDRQNIPYFSSVPETFEGWQNLSKLTNQRVYHILLYQNDLLLSLPTGAPSPSPATPLPYLFCSTSLCVAPQPTERLEEATKSLSTVPIIVPMFEEFLVNWSVYATKY